jgi:hypothetical protein
VIERTSKAASFLGGLATLVIGRPPPTSCFYFLKLPLLMDEIAGPRGCSWVPGMRYTFSRAGTSGGLRT